MLNSINTNIAAYSAQGNIGKASNSASASISRLSSGNRIVRASDDVAALSIGTSLKTGVTTLKQALSNASQGTSLLQVADGALSQVSDILQRQKAIATQANSGTLSDTERGYLNQEFQALKSQIDQISTTTTFSSVKLLDGTLSTSGADGSALTPHLKADATVDTSVTIHGFAGQGVNITGATFTSSGAGDTSFFGDLSKGTFTVTDIDDATADDDNWQVTYVLNGVTYLGTILDATDTTQQPTANKLELVNGDGTGKITLTLPDDLTADTTTTGFLVADSTPGDFQTLLTNAFADATAVVTRTGVAGAGTDVQAETDAGNLQDVTDTDSTIIGFKGTDIVFKTTTSASFDIPDFSDFRSDGYRIGSKLSVTIDGATYTTKAILDNTDLKGTDAFGDGTGIVRFYREGSGPQNLDYLQLDLGANVSATTIAVNTQDDMATFLGDLNDVFHPTGSASGSGSGLTLQVGLKSTDTLSVNINSASTTTLYKDANGSAQTLSVATASGAQSASDILDLAINAVNSARAAIGALQSRLDFTSANLQSSIQNQDAARGSLLDTDVAAESTSYATAQVQLQAGIAVLAQANQIPQNLLKLIS